MMRQENFENIILRVLEGQAEYGNDAARDLLTIWRHSRMTYNAIGQLVESLKIAKSNGYDTSQASELLEKLIAEIAAYYTKTEAKNIAEQAKNYAQTLTSCEMIARTIAE